MKNRSFIILIILVLSLMTSFLFTSYSYNGTNISTENLTRKTAAHNSQNIFKRLLSIKSKFQDTTIPSPALIYGKRGQIFKEIGLNFIPDSERYKNQKNLIAIQTINISPKVNIKNEWLDAIHYTDQEFPSNTIMKEKDLAKNIPIFSIYIKEGNLYDRYYGIISNPYKKGKNWERPCFISYYNNGKIIFSTGAGIRIHGKKTREGKYKNFRIHFRNAYGKNNLKPDTVFSSEAGSINRIIIKKSHYGGFYFVNPLSFDIARKIGCIAPECFPVALFINGKKYEQGIYFAAEGLSKNFIKNHYGHNNFTMIRSKGGNFMDEDFKKLIKWAKDKKQKMTMAEAKKRINLENFTLWWIATIYLGNSDPYQGIALLDKTKKNARWFWTIWDFDQAIRNRGSNKEPVKKIRIWEQVSPLYRVMNNLYIPKNEVRAVIFRRLMLEDSHYAQYMTALFKKIMNEKLTKNFLNNRLAYYEDIANKFKIQEKSYIKKKHLFFSRRNEFIKKILKDYILAPEEYFFTKNYNRNL